MPDVKQDQEATGAPAENPTIEKAMKEAVAAVERRERATRGDEGAPEVAAASEPPGAGPAKNADEAVTEALLKAKGELEEVLQQTQREAKELRDKWLRAAADLENYKKRAGRERDEIAKFGVERMAKDMLVLIDDLDRTVAAAGTGDATGSLGAVLEGVRMVQRKFLGAMEKHGITTFEAAGKAFDPSLHEAVSQAHSDVPAGGVAAEVQRGFMIHGRLLRPALVAVSLGPASKA